MNDYMVSLIRTWVPVGVGAALTWLATEAGIVLDENTSAMGAVFAVALVTAAYYALARAVERAWPVAGSVLVALGIAKAPTYPERIVPGQVEPPSPM
jgi:hypothetical protein